MRKKITYIITNSDLAGAQQHVRLLVEHFSVQFECELVSGSYGYLTTFAQNAGIKTHVISELSRNISPLDDCRAWSKIKKYISESRPNLVHLHSAKAGFLGRLASIGMNIKVVYTVHGWAFSEGNTWLKRIASIILERVISGAADKIILVSNYDSQLAIKYKIASPDKLVVIHNGIKDASNMPALIGGGKQFHIVSLVRFAKQKNLPCMIQAISKVNDKLKVSIAGTGQLKSKIATMIQALGLADIVSLVGEVSDVDALLREGDVFVLSSDWEGLPIAIIEACRAGLPIISTDVGGVNEIVDNGYNGYLVPPKHPQDMADALHVLSNNPELVKKMGRRSREIYLERFTHDQMLKQTEAVYRTCLLA